jgi:hypothetical protein
MARRNRTARVNRAVADDGLPTVRVGEAPTDDPARFTWAVAARNEARGGLCAGVAGLAVAALVVWGGATWGVTTAVLMIGIVALLLVWLAFTMLRMACDDRRGAIEIGSAGLTVSRHGAVVSLPWSRIRRVEVCLVYPSRPPESGPPTPLKTRFWPTAQVRLTLSDASASKISGLDKALSRVGDEHVLDIVRVPLRATGGTWGVAELLAALTAHAGSKLVPLRQRVRE